MKRNYPPDSGSSADAAQAERRIIDQRLEALYSTDQVRNVPRCNIATYCDRHRHVRLEHGSKPNYFDGLSQYSNELGYHYLDPYQALYLMESRQILIHCNELTLSLSEAYHLLIRNHHEFQAYIVFSCLNQNGYYCLRCTTPAVQQKDVGQKLESLDSNDQYDGIDSKTKPLYEINSCQLSYSEVLNRLRDQGPRDLTRSHLKQPHHPDIVISFDAYRRETFSKRKPRKGQPGEPDYYVVIKDKNKTTSPTCIDFLTLADDTVCNKLLFAIIDGDSSLSFVQYNCMDPSRQLNMKSNEWPETIDEARLDELNRSF